MAEHPTWHQRVVLQTMKTVDRPNKMGKRAAGAAYEVWLEPTVEFFDDPDLEHPLHVMAMNVVEDDSVMEALRLRRKTRPLDLHELRRLFHSREKSKVVAAGLPIIQLSPHMKPNNEVSFGVQDEVEIKGHMRVCRIATNPGGDKGWCLVTTVTVHVAPALTIKNTVRPFTEAIGVVRWRNMPDGEDRAFAASAVDLFVPLTFPADGLPEHPDGLLVGLPDPQNIVTEIDGFKKQYGIQKGELDSKFAALDRRLTSGPLSGNAKQRRGLRRQRKMERKGTFIQVEKEKEQLQEHHNKYRADLDVAIAKLHVKLNKQLVDIAEWNHTLHHRIGRAVVLTHMAVKQMAVEPYTPTE